MNDSPFIPREEAQDHFSAALAQRDAHANEALQLRVALSAANRKIAELEAQIQAANVKPQAEPLSAQQ